MAHVADHLSLDDLERPYRSCADACSARHRKVSGTGDLGDCVVADAVGPKPVSGANFPGIREKNRDFGEKLAIRGQPASRNQLSFSWLHRNSLG